VIALALLVVIVHLVVNALSPYGVHRDEFLYAAMGEHLRLWRMDFPPFIAIVARASRLLGDSLVALRLASALAGGAIVLATGAIARELGGRAAAQRAAALAVATAPLFLGPGSLFQPVVFDQLWWTLALLVLLRLRRTGDRRWWLAIGGALGVGLLTKFSIAFVGVGMVLALLAVPERRDLRTAWPWLALVVALVLGSPSVVGQLALDFPVAWQMRDLQRAQLDRLHWLDFVLGQPAQLGPAFVLALVGLAWLIGGRERRWTRETGIAVLAALALLTLAKGKPYYGGPVYPLLLAAGATALAGLRTVRAQRLTLATASVVIVLFNALALPLVLPIVPPEPMARYARLLGMGTSTNYGTTLALPQDYADMLGWEELVAATAEVWNTLPAEERATAVLIGENYGEAGALDYFGARHGLPPVVSTAGSYWFFGPGTRTGRTLVGLGLEPPDAAALFERCDVVRRVGTRWAVEEQQQTPITICRGMKQPLAAIWPGQNPALDD
jgi:4-amino-4-deoxy-L-arabinose transferase-like glycosyltransferase